ncbi:MAG: hypothetical protein QF718_03230 [Phycisphaerales bacterium]|nr:hypothetical protein [Phycisphaerales bacterium]
MPLIDNLLILYKVDKQVRGLRGRVESAKIYLNHQTKQLGDIEIEKAEIDQQRKQRQVTISNIETEIGSIDNRIEHLREELSQAINDKQYSALLAEVNTLKERRKAFEDEELVEMSGVEELDTTTEEINQRIQERQNVLKVAEKELETRQSEISEQLTELEGERTSAAAVIPEEVLSDFDEIADDYDGEAMAAVEVIDRKRNEFSCTSCSLTLPLDAITTMLGNKETVVKCVSCDRILYLEAKTRDEMAPSEK